MSQTPCVTPSCLRVGSASNPTLERPHTVPPFTSVQAAAVTAGNFLRHCLWHKCKQALADQTLCDPTEDVATPCSVKQRTEEIILIEITTVTTAVLSMSHTGTHGLPASCLAPTSRGGKELRSLASAPAHAAPFATPPHPSLCFPVLPWCLAHSHSLATRSGGHFLRAGPLNDPLLMSPQPSMRVPSVPSATPLLYPIPSLAPKLCPHNLSGSSSLSPTPRSERPKMPVMSHGTTPALSRGPAHQCRGTAFSCGLSPHLRTGQEVMGVPQLLPRKPA